MLLGTMTGSLNILLGSWKVPEFILGKMVGTLYYSQFVSDVSTASAAFLELFENNVGDKL